MESLGEEEFDDLYDQLDAKHQMEVDQSVRDFADNAIGSEHWDSDRYTGNVVEFRFYV
jgi:hypothetical protein